jgi:signal transduction histidine kinase
VLVYFTWRRRVPFSWMFWMFGAFIVSCGFTHFFEAVTFYDPLYRLSGLVKLVTAAASWATVIGLVPLVPRALAMRTPEELEREIAERRKAEALLRQAHDGLERRVQGRTAELAAANAALQAEVAERRRAQEERELLLRRERQARAEAEAASRTKDEFLAMLSHELRTPLTAMLGWAHLLRCGKLDEATAARGLGVLERSTRAQSQIIGDLLDVSRITAGKLRLEPRPTELGPALEAAVDAVRPAAAAKGIRLEVELDGAAGPVLGDPTRLQQVFWNLLANAVKFTPEGGEVGVRLARGGGQAVVTVRDTGVGVRPDFLAHVFERFSQADASTTRRYGGLGLGLAIVRHLVELHGGTVTAESAGEGRGATFAVRLPALPARPAAADGGAGRPPGRGAGGLRVLVVDDEPNTREMLALVLSGCGAEVTTVASAREALEALPRVRPDVLISDLAMPGEDGYALIRRVRALPAEEGGRVPAVALTAYALAEDRARALSAGFQLHLPKPVDPAELAAVVENLAAWGARR